jgi:hypothetical protein
MIIVRTWLNLLHAMHRGALHYMKHRVTEEVSHHDVPLRSMCANLY